MTSNWIETFNRLNPVAQEQYKRYSEYRDKNMWSEVPTGQGGDSSDIDTKQWKADSGSYPSICLYRLELFVLIVTPALQLGISVGY